MPEKGFTQLAQKLYFTPVRRFLLWMFKQLSATSSAFYEDRPGNSKKLDGREINLEGEQLEG